ncbi:hypothetical protein LG634_34930 [Streptomyces bambusae]|uniref:hypothetical protein n=1 Tax=Streptomyces bambusae TaxID=1550616 RepID=UPI001CFFC821|nr:hypothetical protein [Streptomyces bambusae]MCB5169984.1 hypothetical protein [Streptomyces bambusae]
MPPGPWWNPQTQSWDTDPEPAATAAPDPAEAPVVAPVAPVAGPPQPVAPPQHADAGPGGPSGLSGADAGPGEGAAEGNPAGGADAPVSAGPADPPGTPGAAPLPAGFVPAPGPAPVDAPGTGGIPSGGFGPALGAGNGTTPGVEAYGAVAPAGGEAFGPGTPGGGPAYGPGPGGGAYGGPAGGGLPRLPELPPLPPLPPLSEDVGGGSGRRERKFLTPVVVVVAVAALVGGAGAVWLVQRDRGAEPQAAPSATFAPAPETAGPTAPEPGTPEASPSPSPSAGGAPDGFRVTDDPKGFTLAVPQDWARSEEDTGVFFRSADGESLLQVFRVDEADMTPLDAVRGASGTLASNPGYAEVSVGEVPGQDGRPAAELVYEYDGSTGNRRRGVERVFVTPGGEKYAVLVRAPASAWPRQQEVLTAALDAFRVR